ncbi:uncharacterized protein RSE6_09940 [Rhynchosporium secalis]|uniref:MYND-type domain-containing protein n=1 Tax=Rhynchosporium secalis TaxID=38038 RepID=A0A1E1MJA7_RHYSE|nr:uncharacterized protein RSE6_09940 [Rhynchosporium secalis]
MSSSQTQPSASNGESSSSSGPPQENTDTQAESSSTSSSTNPTTPPTCTCCHKAPTDTKPLKPCTKCQSVSYCGKECQKAHFKVHKKECAKKAQVYAQTAVIKMEATNRAPKDGFRGGLQKWQFDT